MTVYQGFYLIEMENNEVTSYDGSHDGTKGVSQAMELYIRLGFKKENKEYFMINLSQNYETKLKMIDFFIKYINESPKCLLLVKKQKVKINNSAIKTLKMAGIISS